MATEYQQQIKRRALELLHEEGVDVGDQLHRTLRLLARYRSTLVANTLFARGGDQVRSGPFAGLSVPRQSAEGCLAPKVLGTYESELHPVIEHVAAMDYRTVVNIGSAEGYYAVGLALRLPAAQIRAYDIDDNARRMTRELAEHHGVGDRVTVGGEFTHADFQTLDPETTFVFCDIEGAEVDLIDPSKAPNLARLDMLVELHNLPDIPIYQRFMARFRDSHRLAVVEPGSRDIRAFRELRDLEHLDQLLAFWEWRRGPTPWLMMSAIRP